MRTLTTISFGLVAVVALAGCEFSAYRTINPDDFAEAAAEVVQEEIGTAQTPQFDCGDEYIPMVEGESVVCDFTFDDVEGVVDATITITSVDGDSYYMTVQSDEVPQ